MLVPLKSSLGQARFRNAQSGDCDECCNILDSSGTAFVQMEIVTAFRQQRGNTMCGMTSLAIVLTVASASCTSRDITSAYVDEDDVYSKAAIESASTTRDPGMVRTNPDLRNNSKASVTPLKNTSLPSLVLESKIRTKGMTLDEITGLAGALPRIHRANAIFAEESLIVKHHMRNSDQSLICSKDDLRSILVKVLSQPARKQSLIANYHMTTLGQPPFGGHFSPLAAYHGPSDSVLIMDVWHTETEPVWASVETLWTAMSENYDIESNRPRGLLHLVWST